MSAIYDFEVQDIDGEALTLERYKDKTLLIVNTASKCGFTPQYSGLEELYKRLKEQGFEILAFPCNQFGGQEPGGNEEIAKFCTTRFQISFPLFAKVDVKGKDAHPLYRYLCEALPGFWGTKVIKWNFTKFLVDKKGEPVKRFAPQDTPAGIAKEISYYL